MDTSILVVVLLLIGAASVVTYFLSHWSVAHGGPNWAAVRGGTTLLWAAIALVLLMIAWLPARLLIERLGAQMFGGVAPDRAADTFNPKKQISTMTRGARDAPASNPSSEQELNSRGETSSRTAMQPAASETTSVPSAAPAQAVPSRPHFNPLNPWAATNCVYALDIDPDDPQRWKIDNGCGAPVAIVLGTNDQTSISWKYERGGLLLPDRAQRTVTEEEETRFGARLRYVACFMESASEDDPCLSRVRLLSSQSSQPLETFFEDADIIKRHTARSN